MAKLSVFSGKGWKVIGGHKFRFAHAHRLKEDANKAASEYRLEGYKVRVIPLEDSYGIFASREGKQR